MQVKNDTNELLLIPTKYEISINPDDKCQFFGSPRRLENFITKIHPLLIKCLDNYGIEYNLWLELSTPHININKSSSYPRLHYHGTITLKSSVICGQFLLKSLYLLSRFSNVTYNCYRKDYWPDYCTKNKKLMVSLCKYYKVPYKLKHKMPLIKR